MADDADDIKISLKSDISEGENARKKLAEIEKQIKDLIGTMDPLDQAMIGSNAQFRALSAEADKARRAIEGVTHAKTKLSAGKFQLGLGVANTLQDVIQGGPASGVNNILGLAQNKAVHEIAGDAVAAAGGIRVLAAAFGTLSVVASTAFLSIHEGLHSNKLEWGDLGDVIDKMTDGAITKTGKVWSDTFGAVRDTLGNLIGGIADVTIGWNDAAEAVRTHKDEVDRATAALAAYKKAQETLSGFKSPEETEQAKRGKLFGQELANLGGKRGIQGTIDDLADAQVGRYGDKMEEVEVNELDEKGQPTGRTKKMMKSRRDIAREGLAQDFANAAKGDEASQNVIKKRLQGLGRDTSGLDRAQRGKTAADELKAAKEQQEAEKKAQDEELKELYDQSQREEADKKRLKDAKDKAEKAKKEADKAALDKATKATDGTAVGARIDDSLLRNALKAGGRPGVAQKQTAEELSKELQSKGLSKEEADSAAGQMVKEHANKLNDQIMEGAMTPKKMGAPDRISSTDFARSVESAGAKDAAKLQNSVDAMKEKLTDMVRLMQRGARLVK